ASASAGSSALRCRPPGAGSVSTSRWAPGSSSPAAARSPAPSTPWVLARSSKASVTVRSTVAGQDALGGPPSGADQGVGCVDDLGGGPQVDEETGQPLLLPDGERHLDPAVGEVAVVLHLVRLEDPPGLRGQPEGDAGGVVVGLDHDGGAVLGRRVQGFVGAVGPVAPVVPEAALSSGS